MTKVTILQLILFNSITSVAGVNEFNNLLQKNSYDEENIIYKEASYYFDKFTINKIEREPVFTKELDYLGNIVDFTYNDDQEGYFIFDNRVESPLIINFNFNSFSPYYNLDGTKIFDNYHYYTYENRHINEINLASTNGGSSVFQTTLSFDFTEYTRMTNTSISELYNYSQSYFNSMSGTHDSCTPISGVVILNYFNKKLNNKLLKIPSSGLDAEGNMSKEYAVKYFKDLYDAMMTNIVITGTYPPQAMVSFRNYVEKNTDYELSLWMINNMNQYLDYLSQGYLLSINTSQYYFTNQTPPVLKGNSSDKYTINFNYCNKQAHSFIGFQAFEYNHETFELPTEVFLKIADGWSTGYGGQRYYYVDTLHGFLFPYAIKIQ